MKEVFKKRLLETLNLLKDKLSKLPDSVAEKLKKDIEELERILLNKRNPRLMIAGRRGSGKSSMINAFFGEKVAKVGHIESETGKAKWYNVEKDDQVIELIDTRGLGEGSKPNEFDNASDARESLLNEIKDKHPDVILFTCKAKEVDSRISEDIDDIEYFVEQVDKIHDYKLPILAVITHCDELTPKTIRLHKEKSEQHTADYEEKLNRVNKVESKIDKQIKNHTKLANCLITTMGVSSYMSWRDDGTNREDERWRIEELLNYIFDQLPDEAKLEFARATKIQKIQKKITNKITLGASAVCAALAAIPIPVGDLIPITSLQITMITMIAYVGGKKPSMKTAKEFLNAIGANIGAGFAFREVVRALVKFLPVAGEAISAGIAYAATYGIGKAATAYFIEEVSKEKAAEIYKTNLKSEKRKETGTKLIESG